MSVDISFWKSVSIFIWSQIKVTNRTLLAENTFYHDTIHRKLSEGQISIQEQPRTLQQILCECLIPNFIMYSLDFDFMVLTLVLLVANLADSKNLKIDWNLGTWVLIESTQLGLSN